MTTHAIFFDLDDTLCPTSATREPRARLAFDLLSAAGHRLDWDAFFAGILEFDPATDFIRGLGPVLQDLGIAETDAGRQALGLWFFEGCSDLIQPYDGALDVLDALARDHVLGVITNGPAEIQRRKLEALRCEAHFHPDLFVTSDLAGCFKPDEGIFRLALERAGVAPHEAVMIGDQPHVDVAGARALGMGAVWFNPHNRPPSDGIAPDATLRTFAELPGLLESWRG